jgi:hypothetical protein
LAINQKFSICTIVQGWYGHRIASNLIEKGPKNWKINICEIKRKFPEFIEKPEEYIPKRFPKCDLLISLGEHPAILMLLPNLVKISGANAVIAPVDNSKWVPPGLRKQISEDLRDLGVAFAFPRPFCSMDSNYDNKLINEFVKKFGRPELRISLKNGIISEVNVLRGSPCGSTHYTADKLKSIDQSQAEKKASLFVQTYPCLASRVRDSESNIPLIHIAANIIKKTVHDSLIKSKTDNNVKTIPTYE